jgi:dTDP-4-amino-4,6-dideoxygalactose transaminase
VHVPFLDLKPQYRQIETELAPKLCEIMAAGAFIGGPEVEAFEAEFAAFCESPHCVGLNSGTDALRFALMAAGVGPGDEVITVPHTFIATTEAISQAGAVPVFADIDPRTCTLDPGRLEAAVTPKTKAVIPVHLYGQPADMDPILDIARRRRLWVVEDACQAHGARYKGRMAGSMGVVGCFSFYPGKNLGAFGDAGAAVTADEGLARRMRMLRDHGQSRKYVHDIEGYNGRLDAMQAAVLRVKLKRLEDWNQARRANAAHYTHLLADVPGVGIVGEAGHSRSVYHLYVILVEDRDGLQRFLAEKGVGTGLHYPVPLHLQKAYAHRGFKKGDFPASERTAETLLSLPMFAELTREQIEYVADCISEYMNGTRHTAHGSRAKS